MGIQVGRIIAFGAIMGGLLASGPAFAAIKCKPARASDRSWNSVPREAIIDQLAEDGVELVHADIAQNLLADFAAEFTQIPKPYRVAFKATRSKIRLLRGQGVIEDPSWRSANRTFDGRSWVNVPGSGGAPFMAATTDGYWTRFVVNRLYVNHGSSDLVAHEFGHAVDSLTEQDRWSGSEEWKRLSRRGTAFYRAIEYQCGTYCSTHPDEGFAEAFALYYGCADGRKYLRQFAPEVADWIRGLEKRI